VGIVGAIATLCLMPNYTMQTRRFDIFGFMLLAAGMATLTLALDGQKGLGISPCWLAGLVAIGLAPCCCICGTPAATPGRCSA
jgi:DHA2 family multidrug resistance protein-like MFS transporter